MHPVLRLYEDVLANGAIMELPPHPRMIFVTHGTIVPADRLLHDGEAWYGQDRVALAAGREGATVWRWELVPDGAADGAAHGPGIASREKISARLETLPAGDLLWRGDTVAFPPGGCAYRHRHQGPGIRCLIDGGIRIDTHGGSTSYGPGGAWFESGPDPVFAQAAADRATRFVRAMILPAVLLGKSSIEYLDAEDKAKPKSQQYRLLIDAPLAR